MNLLYVAQLASDHNRDEIWVNGFRRAGHNINTFSTHAYERRLNGIWGKIQTRLHFGREIARMRSDLIDMVESINPDWIHFRLPLHFDPQTIHKLKSYGCLISSYYNDNPFSKGAVLGLHGQFKRAISEYDIHFIFREMNIYEFERAGSKKTVYCAPFYDPTIHNLNPEVKKREKYDAVFIGHWEDDGRIDHVNALLKVGYKVKVAGPLWDKVSKKMARDVGSVAPVFGQAFAAIYGSAQAGLCFFSKINGDSWTRRPLEIVASGGLLVCERTEEAISYFEDRKEAYFFSSEKELLSVMQYIEKHPEEAQLVRRRGIERLQHDKHTIDDRINTITFHINQIRADAR